MPTARSIDQNGYMTVSGCPISSYGIFDYSAGQIGLDGDPNRIVKVFRPREEIADPAAIESFKVSPFIDEHMMLSGFEEDEQLDSIAAPEEKGIHGVLTSNVYFDDPWLRGDIKIFSRSLKRAIDSGKADLSLGYSCDWELSPGSFNGQRYEVVQRNLRGNHIALVKKGRVTGARVLDGACFDSMTFDIWSDNMPKGKTGHAKDEGLEGVQGMPAAVDGGNPAQELLAILPEFTKALQTFFGQEAKEPEHQASAEPVGGEQQAEPKTVDAQPAASEQGEGAAVSSGDPASSGSEPDNTAGAAVSSGEAAGGQSEASGGMAEHNPMENGQSEGQASVGGEPAAKSVTLQDVICVLKDFISQNSPVAADTNVAGPSSNEPGKVDEENAMGKAQDTAGSLAELAKGKAADEALGRFYADSAFKDRLYKRLSPIVGAFDHAEMDATQVVLYGVKELGIKCAKGTESIALDAYLNGIEAASKAAADFVPKGFAADSANVSGCPELDKYLKGE